MAEKKCGKKMDIVIDVEGPEIRVGNISPLELKDGMIVEIGKDIPLDDSIISQLEVGMICCLDDGKIELKVALKCENKVKCEVIRGGKLLSRKSFTVIGHTFTRPVLTDRDIDNLKNSTKYGVSAMLQPFVHSSKDVEAVRKVLYEQNCQGISIMAKIEDEIGIDNMEDIISASDYVVFARGDLGNNMDMWKLPKLQKRLATVCRKQGKPFIVATQLLASMENNPTPTRAEMNDIFNCTVDGAYGLMLTGETASGKYPSKAIEFLHNASKEAFSD
jgi:pyruvate kinase